MNLLLLSTSTIHGKEYLMYCKNDIESFFSSKNRILFVPFARPSGITHSEYTKTASEAFNKFELELKGIHEFKSNQIAMEWATGVFIGGGNSFLLLKELIGTHLFALIKSAVKRGLPYMGTSAGSNIAGIDIGTSNDMPIVYPTTFSAFSFISFNINPHYLDPLPDSTHMGENRETRILEFHQFNSQPVIGLREGGFLHVQNSNIILKGNHTARIFESGKAAYEIESGTNLSKFFGKNDASK